MTEDEMVGWPHQLYGHEFEQAPGDGEGLGSLACCSPWGHRVGTAEQLNNSSNIRSLIVPHSWLPSRWEGSVRWEQKLWGWGGHSRGN